MASLRGACSTLSTGPTLLLLSRVHCDRSCVAPWLLNSSVLLTHHSHPIYLVTDPLITDTGWRIIGQRWSLANLVGQDVLFIGLVNIPLTNLTNVDVTLKFKGFLQRHNIVSRVQPNRTNHLSIASHFVAHTRGGGGVDTPTAVVINNRRYQRPEIKRTSGQDYQARLHWLGASMCKHRDMQQGVKVEAAHKINLIGIARARGNWGGNIGRGVGLPVSGHGGVLAQIRAYALLRRWPFVRTILLDKS